MRDDVHRDSRVHERSADRADHVNARGDHRRGVDQRGYGRRTGHRVGQPDVQRNLRRFTGGADEQQQADGGEDAGAVSCGMLAAAANTLPKSSVPKVMKIRNIAERETEVADAVDDECFLAGIAGELLEEVEADQQVAAQPDAFPSDEHHQVVRAEHQNQHEEHEQVQVGEEPVIAAFMRHVADRVNVNQQPMPVTTSSITALSRSTARSKPMLKSPL